jgi:hypothetical protein
MDAAVILRGVYLINNRSWNAEAQFHRHSPSNLEHVFVADDRILKITALPIGASALKANALALRSTPRRMARDKRMDGSFALLRHRAPTL